MQFLNVIDIIFKQPPSTKYLVQYMYSFQSLAVNSFTCWVELNIEMEAYLSDDGIKEFMKIV